MPITGCQFWKKIKEKNGIVEEGVVGNWNLVTKLILALSPYEFGKKVVDKHKKRQFEEKYKGCSLLKMESNAMSDSHSYMRIKNQEKVRGKCEKCKMYQDVKTELDAYWKKKYLSVEWWTRGCMVVSCVCACLIYYLGRVEYKWVLIVIALIGILRVLEIVIRQMRTLLFDTIGKQAIRLKGARRSIILLCYNVVEMIFWFSSSFMVVYIIGEGSGGECYLREKYKFFHFITSSALQFLTYGDGYTEIGNCMQQNEWLLTITFGEIIVGFIVILVSFARMLSLLPDVSIQDEE